MSNVRLSLFIIALFQLVCFVSIAQNSKTAVDTPLISFKNKPKLFLTLDRTSSFVGGKNAATNEIRVGLEFRKKIRFGIGYAALVSDIYEDRTITTEKTQKDSLVQSNLKLSYFTISGEYTFYETKRWQITSPLTVGIGSSYFSYFEEEGKDNWITKKSDEGTVLLLGASGIATYRIFRWVGLSAGLGLRQVVVNNGKVKESFNSPVYLFRIRIFMGEIYKSIFPRGIFGKHSPPYSNEYWD